jgi:hypothetical protein
MKSACKVTGGAMLHVNMKHGRFKDQLRSWLERAGGEYFIRFLRPATSRPVHDHGHHGLLCHGRQPGWLSKL